MYLIRRVLGQLIATLLSWKIGPLIVTVVIFDGGQQANSRPVYSGEKAKQIPVG